MIEGVNHVSITVQNMDESLGFYQKYFNMKKVNEFLLSIDAEGSLDGVTIRAVYLDAGGDAFELIEYQNKPADRKNELSSWDVGAPHIALSMKGIKDFYTRYKGELKFLSSPIHSVAEGLDATWIYFKDPNGTIIELSEDHLTDFQQFQK